MTFGGPLFLFLFCATLSQGENPPVISSEWEGRGITTSKTTVKGVTSTETTPSDFYSSAIYSSYRQDSRSYLPGFPDETSSTTISDDLPFIVGPVGEILPGYENATWYPLTSTFILKTTGELIILNGICRHSSTTYSDPLAIAPYTTYNGSTLIGNDKCDQWIYVSPTYNATLYVLSDNPSIVRLFSTQTPGYYYEYNFHSFIPDVNYNGTTIFDSPDSCTPPGMICEGEGVQELEMIRFHSPRRLSMANDNSADYIGDAYFICIATIGQFEPTYTQISKYIVSVDTAWGNYAFCNYGFCWSMNLYNVGRESSSGLEDNAGQCNPESIFGKWYSLAEEGHCPEDEEIGFNNCTWRDDRRVVTIELQCLLDLGFVQACKEDKGFPFPQATQLLKQALDTCPPPQNIDSSPSPSNEIPEETNYQGNPFRSNHFSTAFQEAFEVMRESVQSEKNKNIL